VNKRRDKTVFLKEYDEYDIKLLFLYELINEFTKKVNIRNNFFYFKINEGLKNDDILKVLSYNRDGLLYFENILQQYNKHKQYEKSIYYIAPYFSSLSRILALIYEESSRILGERRAKVIFKNCFRNVKKKYPKAPELRGYVPVSAEGSSFTLVTYGVALMDNLISYLITDIIKKPIKKQIKKEQREISEKFVSEFFGGEGKI